MEDIGTVVLEVKDIDWDDSHTIPTFDDVKVDELTSMTYIGDPDVSSCTETITEGKDISVIESVIIGSPDDTVKEITFSPVMEDSIKNGSLDIKEMTDFEVAASEKELMPLDMVSEVSKGKKKNTAPLKFKCDLCSLRFISHNSLQIHIRRHMGYKPFVCEVCEKAYPSKNQLDRHMRNHTNKREHFCGDCGKGFLEVSSLKKHASFKHGANENTYNLYRIKEEVSDDGEKVIFIKTYRNGDTNIRRFRLIPDNSSSCESEYSQSNKRK